MFEERINNLRKKLDQEAVDVAIITDDDSVYYYSGYYDYLHMEFWRPTILIVPRNDKSILITPTVDVALADKETKIDVLKAWNDGVGSEWREHLPTILKGKNKIGIELNHMPPLVRNYIDSIVDKNKIFNVTPVITEMRMVKSNEELQIARYAGQVAVAMMTAGRSTITDGVPEFEVAIAASNAGTRKASEILNSNYKGTRMSPLIHFLHIMASGEHITTTHHRASTRIMRKGEPAYLCFCGMTNFHRFKLGFDRLFFIDEIKEKSHEKAYEIAIESQAAALKALKPGVKAEDVHAAYAEVIQSAGYDYPLFRCGRGVGFSFLEEPQLVCGSKTIIKPGMVFAVDGSTSSENFRSQVGDSFIVTDDGYEEITPFPKQLQDSIIK
ncbi:MAG: Creatinase [Alphaproteobacteria bacterium MarineAlpha5_Bin11]|nr:peptidase M24 [Pelagibacteraceae bacterium]PPR44405.1 MAG: Creatinase [Alphaproteobacteria bacterium MarineAlpha5_Bin11]PPR50825.1 MAG: Creatinase [Alphaproteobacteria bacterium MarineAlpha5_Bin10]|tara:strand:+ start:13510 stop:14661 length:1152 start_codon:yes stop_codon:yes gene_type:complete